LPLACSLTTAESQRRCRLCPEAKPLFCPRVAGRCEGIVGYFDVPLLLLAGPHRDGSLGGGSGCGKQGRANT
jgi:hypothetical protein